MSIVECLDSIDGKHRWGHTEEPSLSKCQCCDILVSDDNLPDETYTYASSDDEPKPSKCLHLVVVGKNGKMFCELCKADLGECPHEDLTVYNEHVVCPTCGARVIRFSPGFQTHPTGAVRESAKKPFYHCLPVGPLRRVAQRYAMGKYEDYNWQKGLPYSSTFNHLMEHLSLWREGNKDEDHLAAAVFNIMCLMWYDDHKPELNDMRP